MLKSVLRVLGGVLGLRVAAGEGLFFIPGTQRPTSAQWLAEPRASSLAGWVPAQAASIP